MPKLAAIQMEVAMGDPASGRMRCVQKIAIALWHSSGSFCREVRPALEDFLVGIVSDQTPEDFFSEEAFTDGSKLSKCPVVNGCDWAAVSLHAETKIPNCIRYGQMPIQLAVQSRILRAELWAVWQPPWVGHG